jgi:hypothetical protein
MLTVVYNIQQNSVNILQFRNPDDVALEECNPNAGSFAVSQKKVLSMKQADIRDMFKMNSKCVCASNVVISHDHLSSILSIKFFAYQET